LFDIINAERANAADPLWEKKTMEDRKARRLESAFYATTQGALKAGASVYRR
jgi:hypothetical protein